MGSYESIFEVSEEQSGRELNVSNSDWITGHAGKRTPTILLSNKIKTNFILDLTGCKTNQ